MLNVGDKLSFGFMLKRREEKSSLLSDYSHQEPLTISVSVLIENLH